MATGIPRERMAALRHALETRLEELREEIRIELARSNEESHAELAGRVHDTEDEALADLLVDVNLDAVARHQEEVREIENALGRMRAGTYGRCIDCGTDIDPARLEARPAAARCRDCQQTRERTHGGGRQPSL